MASRLLIFGWHNINGTWCFPARPGQGRDGLTRQLRWLDRTCNVVDLYEGLTSLSEGRPLRGRAVALTFDDGYRDNLDDALPILERLGLPATFFLVPRLLSRVVTAWWEHLAWAFERTERDTVVLPQAGTASGDEILDVAPRHRRAALDRVAERLKACDDDARQRAVASLIEQLDPMGSLDTRRIFLDWDGARQLVQRGFAVGSHSLEHRILGNEMVGMQQADLSSSRTELQDRLGVDVPCLAYPNGRAQDFNADTVEAARLAGYHYALTTVAGWNSEQTPPYEVRRFVVYPERGSLGLGCVAEHASRTIVSRLLSGRRAS